MPVFRPLCVLGLPLWLACSDARADTALCTPIVSVPVTLSTPGTYCLDKNLTMSGTASAAIAIAANQVTLDCNDRTITRYSSSTARYGVLASGRTHVKVRNCGLHLFDTGIALVGVRIGDIRGNTISTPGSGMLLTGHTLEVRDNVVAGIYGTSTWPNIGMSLELYSTGQYEVASRIVGNRLAGSAYAIGLVGAGDVVVDGNTLRLRGNGGPRSAIWLIESQDLPSAPVPTVAIVRRNDVFGFGASAIYVDSGSRALCSENYISGFGSEPVVNCATDSRANTVW